jgi:NitT/TauT family transport system permease protein
MSKPPADAVAAGISADEARLLSNERLRQQKRARQRTTDRILVTVSIIALWEFVVWIGWVHPFFVSRPSLIAVDLWKMFSTGFIYKHLGVTMWEAIAGLVIGAVLGIGTGFVAALSQRVADALIPLIVAFNSMPRVAIAPLFIIWLGFGPASKIGLVALVVYFAVFFNTFSGMRSVDPVLVNSIRVMGASRLQALWIVSLPHTMAWVFAAMHTSISLALIGAVVGEFIGSTAGIGWIMVQATGTLETTRLFSTMIVLAVVGAGLFAIVNWAEHYILRWRPKASG